MQPLPVRTHVLRSLMYALWFGVAASGAQLIPGMTTVSVVAPAMGLAVMWLRRYSTLPRVAADGTAIAVLATLDALLAGEQMPDAAVLGGSTLVGAACAAAALRRVLPGERPGLEFFADGVRLAAVSAACGVASAGALAAGAWLVGDAVLLAGTPLVLIRDALGCLVVLGVQMSYRSWRRPADLRPWFRGLALETVVTTAVYSVGLALAPWVSAPFVALPVTMWVAFGAGRFRASLHAAWVAVLTVAMATVPEGPFQASTIVDRYLVAQAFIGVVCLVSVGLALVRAEQRRATQEAEATADRLRRTIDNAVIAHLTVAAGADGALVIGRANPAAGVLLGVPPGALPGRGWLDFVAPEQRAEVAAGLAGIEAGERAAWVGEIEHVRADGSRLWVLVTAADMEHEDAGGRSWHVVQLLDVTGQYRLREELAYRVLHDELTGLATRELLHLRIADALETSEGLVLLYLDLDDFKGINDTMGHAAGDAVLTAVARRLRAAARPGDTVARLGGDEFVVCCPGSAAVAASGDIARRMLDAVSAPISVDGRVLAVKASVGVATAAPGDTLERVLRAADTSMYAVKHRKRAVAPGPDPVDTSGEVSG